MNKVQTTAVVDTPQSVNQLPPIKCAIWCWDGSGHADASHVDDQWCTSPDQSITLTAEPLQIGVGDPRESGPVPRYLSDLRAFVGREAYSTRTLVHLVHNDGHEIKMTVEEAREHVRHLVGILALEQYERTDDMPQAPDFGWA